MIDLTVKPTCHAQACNAFMEDGKEVWVDSQPDPARPARSCLRLKPAEALELPGVDAEPEPKPEGPGDDVETASVATNKSEHPPALAEPKRSKAKAKETKDALIPNPPQLPEDMAKQAKQQGQSFADTSGVVEVSLDEQRQLKKKLEAEAKEQAEQKKQAALDKKQIAADKAIEKAEKKLREAQAKAAQLQSKAPRKSTKRKLEADFASAAEPGQSAPPESPAKSRRSRKKSNTSPNQKSPAIKLSPKAKSFASGSRKPNPKDATQNRATAALTLLREKKLYDLTLPPAEFSKKNLGCNTCLQYMCDTSIMTAT